LTLSNTDQPSLLFCHGLAVQKSNFGYANVYFRYKLSGPISMVVNNFTA